MVFRIKCTLPLIMSKLDNLCSLMMHLNFRNIQNTHRVKLGYKVLIKCNLWVSFPCKLINCFWKQVQKGPCINRKLGGTWVTRLSVRFLLLVQVMISWVMRSSPKLALYSVEGFCLRPSIFPSPLHFLSQINQP